MRKTKQNKCESSYVVPGHQFVVQSIVLKNSTACACVFSMNEAARFVHTNSYRITLDNDLFAVHCFERLSVRTHDAIAEIANGKNIFELNAASEEVSLTFSRTVYIVAVMQHTHARTPYPTLGTALTSMNELGKLIPLNVLRCVDEARARKLMERTPRALRRKGCGMALCADDKCQNGNEKKESTTK